MSGIAGIVGRGSLDELERMASAMAFRGPNRRLWSPYPDVYFAEVGHEVGAADREAIALTCSVRDASGDYVDAATLASRLRADASDCLRNLRGNFALACLEPGSGGVILATDPIAYRTLYVMQLPERWVFASDYKALLALADCPAALNRDALQSYLSSMGFDIKYPLLAGAAFLSHGALARLTRESLRRETYLRQASARVAATRQQSAASLRACLETSVSRLLQGHARIAATLSAGLDSASIVALVRHVRPDIEISTYTIGYGPDDPEIIGARQAADHFRTNHHEVFFDNAELEHLLPRYVWLTEDLIGNGEAVLQQRIVERIHQDERILFTGHGPDNQFAGMPRHRLLWMIDRAPPPLRGGLQQLLRYSQTRELPQSWLGRQLTRRAYGEGPRASARVVGAHPLSMPRERLQLDGYLRTTAGDIAVFQYHEPVEDGARLILAAPFAEAEVLALSQVTPLSHMISARYQKKVVREALSDLMPGTLNKRPKAIQRLRCDASLSGVLLGLAEKFDVRRRLGARGLLARRDIDAILGHADGRFSHTALLDLWTLVCSELWMQTFIDGRGQRPLDGPEASHTANARAGGGRA
jgi:asparagine synthase (glutamine-hydrolysing)